MGSLSCDSEKSFKRANTGNGKLGDTARLETKRGFEFSN